VQQIGRFNARFSGAARPISRPESAPPELRQIAFEELESAERHELTAEEEAAVAKRLADLGYL
jgi:hypothetical protein